MDELKETHRTKDGAQYWAKTIFSIPLTDEVVLHFEHRELAEAWMHDVWQGEHVEPIVETLLITKMTKGIKIG